MEMLGEEIARSYEFHQRGVAVYSLDEPICVFLKTDPSAVVKQMMLHVQNIGAFISFVFAAKTNLNDILNGSMICLIIEY